MTNIAHEFGSWLPVRFLPIPQSVAAGPAGEPAFYAVTSRMCRGVHDWRCTHTESRTFGPLAALGVARTDVFQCPNCGHVQPPESALSLGESSVCLGCSDLITWQQTDAHSSTTAALSAAAALYAATGTLRHAKDADPHGYLALLEATGDTLRMLMEDAAWAVKQDPRRAGQSGYRNLVMIARQITANAREYAKLHVEPVAALDKETEE